MLLFMEENGSRGDLTMSSTSEDVARVGKHYADREINDQLKDIYRKARYSPETVTSEEAKKAREIVKTIIR